MTDPAIKLFGKTIPLRPHEDVPCTAANDQIFDASTSPSSSSLSSSSSLQEEQSQKAQQQPPKQEEDKDGSDQNSDEATKIELTAPVFDESMEPATSTGFGGSTATANGNRETTTENASKTQQEQNGNLKDQKTVKKPDKILPCPRCNSLDTKFCYYNNYNVNQPRHFCKNCQRYWTAGGTMRNVPVGAGRRKNKNSSSHYRHMTFSEALQTARNDMPQAIHHIPLKHNGTVLSFGSDSPLCESMASVLSLTEKAMRNCHRNGFHRPEEQRIPVSSGSCENGEEHSSGSSVTASNSGEDGQQADVQEPLARNCQGFAPPPPPPPVPCFPATPWTYPWNSAQWSPPPVAAPAFCASSFPIPFYPAPAYWGCAIPGAWSIPWMSPPSGSPTAANGSSGPNSPTLGKHAREGDTLKQNDSDREDAFKEKSSERCLWIPKTLRIDDPGEAARSSIWATLGIKKDNKGDGISGGGLFKAFQPKKGESNPNSEVLHANPAALSRSLNFQESS